MNYRVYVGQNQVGELHFEISFMESASVERSIHRSGGMLDACMVDKFWSFRSTRDVGLEIVNGRYKLRPETISAIKDVIKTHNEALVKEVRDARKLWK